MGSATNSLINRVKMATFISLPIQSAYNFSKSNELTWTRVLKLNSAAVCQKRG